MLTCELIKLFADHDPCGFIAMGSPRDEYAPEAEILLGDVKIKDAPVFDFQKDLIKDLYLKIIEVLTQMEIVKYANDHKCYQLATEIFHIENPN